MTDPEIFPSLDDPHILNPPEGNCIRCGKQMYRYWCGNAVDDGKGGWAKICMACLRPDED